MTPSRRLLAAALVGTACTLVLALVTGMPGRPVVELVAWACGAALAAGLLGAAALAALRTRPVTVQITVAALTAVAAVAAGAMAAAQVMFISTHDFDVLIVVLAAAGTVGVVLAMALGQRVATSSRALEVVARGIGRGDGSGAPSFTLATAATGELADLGRELEEMSHRLEEARRQERAVESSRRELVAWVSHDLRTPLAGIRALVEALEDGVVDDPETVARYHRTLREEADRLALLVDDLFELSSLQAGAIQLQLERASLVDVVSDALAASAPTARAKGVHLEGRLTARSLELRLSTPEVARALRNLLENAIRHTPADGAVSVDVGVEGDRAVVSVADACGGIPEGELPRVFEPAFRGESARSPVTGGRGGLGLAIVRGIVEAHHGDVDVRNEGEGCRFTVRLPLGVDA
jgi:signal transduction histidine kinase